MPSPNRGTSLHDVPAGDCNNPWVGECQAEIAPASTRGTGHIHTNVTIATAAAAAHLHQVPTYARCRPPIRAITRSGP